MNCLYKIGVVRFLDVAVRLAEGSMEIVIKGRLVNTYI